jgi:hypothetical protein
MGEKEGEYGGKDQTPIYKNQVKKQKSNFKNIE